MDTTYGATANGHLEVVKVLLTTGPCVEKIGQLHQSPLHLAMIHNNERMIAELMKQGATPTLTDDYGRTCIDWASTPEHLSTLINPKVYLICNTSQEMQTQILKKSVRFLCEKLIRAEKPNIEPGLHRLEHCLIHLQDFAEAIVAFRKNAEISSKDHIVTHRAWCNSCQTRENIRGPRFVCKICCDTDLCQDCMVEYGKRSMPQVCCNHSFLEYLLSSMMATFQVVAATAGVCRLGGWII